MPIVVQNTEYRGPGTVEYRLEQGQRSVELAIKVTGANNRPKNKMAVYVTPTTDDGVSADDQADVPNRQPSSITDKRGAAKVALTLPERTEASDLLVLIEAGEEKLFVTFDDRERTPSPVPVTSERTAAGTAPPFVGGPGRPARRTIPSLGTPDYAPVPQRPHDGVPEEIAEEPTEPISVAAQEVERALKPSADLPAFVAAEPQAPETLDPPITPGIDEIEVDMSDFKPPQEPRGVVEETKPNREPVMFERLITLPEVVKSEMHAAFGEILNSSGILTRIEEIQKILRDHDGIVLSAEVAVASSKGTARNALENSSDALRYATRVNGEFERLREKVLEGFKHYDGFMAEYQQYLERRIAALLAAVSTSNDAWAKKLYEHYAQTFGDLRERVRGYQEQISRRDSAHAHEVHALGERFQIIETIISSHLVRIEEFEAAIAKWEKAALAHATHTREFRAAVDRLREEQRTHLDELKASLVRDPGIARHLDERAVAAARTAFTGEAAEIQGRILASADDAIERMRRSADEDVTRARGIIDPMVLGMERSVANAIAEVQRATTERTADARTELDERAATLTREMRESIIAERYRDRPAWPGALLILAAIAAACAAIILM